MTGFTVLLALLPGLMLLLVLATGHYPLEDALERLRPRRARRRPPRLVAPPGGRPLLSGGRLLLVCTGTRGPPR